MRINSASGWEFWMVDPQPQKNGGPEKRFQDRQAGTLLLNAG